MPASNRSTTVSRHCGVLRLDALSPARLIAGYMNLRPHPILALILALGTPLSAFGVRALSAQQPEGDAAWNAGRYDEARSAYERVLAQDPAAFRANFRVGILLSWEGKLDSSLVLLARARAASPDDTELRLTQARVLAWHQRYREAIAAYDSLLAEQPDLEPAAVGRAEALSWWGRHTEAERDYRSVLARNPRSVDALVGLGYLYHWQGRDGPAARLVRTALAIDSTHATLRKLDREVRTSTRSTVETGASWSNDSDRNTAFGQTVGANARLSDALRAFGSAGVAETSDPTRDATRVGGEAGLTWAVGRIQLTGAGGARRLDPDSSNSRTAATYRGRLSYRPAPAFGVSASYFRVPFDETANLIDRELDFESLEAGFDASLGHGLSLFGGASAAWISDSNERTGGVAQIIQTIRRRFFVGAFGRTLSYDRKGTGYFSPDRFRLLEGLAGYTIESGTWDARLSGGLGAQQVGRDGAAQSEWHLEARIGRRWGIGNRVDLFGLVTNSAVSSTTGAFRYRSAGLTVRLGI
jgi:tetratricopeptide (TPR) repeat protein